MTAGGRARREENDDSDCSGIDGHGSAFRHLRTVDKERAAPAVELQIQFSDHLPCIRLSRVRPSEEKRANNGDDNGSHFLTRDPRDP